MTHTLAAYVVLSFFAVLANAQDPWTPSPLCPFPSDDLTRSPYEGDCTKFWECYQGARYVMTCPAGLEYNEREFRCDTPSLAQCDPDATVTYPTYPHTQDPTATTGTPFTPDPMCPYPSEILTFYPYPLNCSQYWECFEGKKYLMSCPPNLFWNVDHDYCDFLENVDCNKNAASTTPSTSGSPTVTTPSDPNVTVTTVGPTVWTPDPQCPYPSEELVFFPYPDDCSLYWECYEGNKFLMSCPSGLYWNDLAHVCDYPQNVNCNRTSTPVNTIPTAPTAPGTTSATIPTAPTAAPTTTTSAPTTPAGTTTWTPHPDCPYPSDDIIFFPYPSDCKLYWECYEGNRYLLSCPGELYWNHIANICDYYENVDCNRPPITTTPRETIPTAPSVNGTTVSPTIPTTNTTTAATTSPPPGTNTTTSAPTTPGVTCENTPDGTYFPDPFDCTRYYECDNGKGVLMQCPDGLYWNDKAVICDYPENVRCVPITSQLFVDI